MTLPYSTLVTIPYPTLPYSYPTLPYLSYPTLPYSLPYPTPTLHYPYPYLYPYLRDYCWFIATLSEHKSLLFFWCHEILLVLVRCDSFVTLWYIIGPLILLSFLFQRGYFWFMATLSAPKVQLFLVPRTPGRCGSFVTLWYIFGLLTLWSFLVQRSYFWFMATLSAPL